MFIIIRPSQKVEKNNGNIYQNLIVSISVDETTVIFLFFFVYSLNIPQCACNQKHGLFFFFLHCYYIKLSQSFILYKVKPKGKVRWTGSRTRGRWKYSSNDESEGSDSEKSSAASEEEEEKESEEAILADDDEPCKKCGLPNHPELVRT